MRKGLSFLLFLMLMRFVAVGQVSPTLLFSPANGVITLSWYDASGSHFSLQTTTNLSKPATWTDLPLTFFSDLGNAHVPMTGPQQFFRLAQQVPIYQFAIFYNLNMELDPGATMTIIGPVFSNGGIWAGSSVLTFDSTVAAVGIIATNNSDPFATNFTGAGPSTFKVQPVSGVGALDFLGFGTNNDPAVIRSLLNLPPSGTSPYSSTGQLYFINQTDLIISNSSAGLISAYFQDPNNISPLTYIPPDATQITTNGSVYTTNHIYSFATNATFYDYREGKTVKAVQLDIGALNTWLGGAGSIFNINL